MNCKPQHYVRALHFTPDRDFQEIAMSSCIHNETVGLYYRWMRETPTPQPRKIDQLRLARIVDKTANEIARHFDATPFDLKNFLKKKRGKLGVRYSRAVKDLIKNGFDFEKDSKISSFTKNELYLLNATEDVKKPRIIMGRDPKFNLFYSAFVEKYEEALGCIKGVTCCMDFKDVGEAFRDLERGECLVKGDDNVINMGDVYVEGDATSYESSQRAIALEIEYKLMRSVFEKFFPELIEQFDDLFACKTHKTGKTLNGLKFDFRYCRGSGDTDTTSGNTGINKVTTEYFIEENLGRSPCDYVNTYALFGIDAKLEIRTNYHDVNYCSGKFIKVNARDFHYVQDLRKLMRRVQFCINDQFYDHLDTYYHSIGYMYTILYKGIPLYQDLGRHLMSCKNKGFVDVRALEAHYGAHNAFQWHQKRVDFQFREKHNLLYDIDSLPFDTYIDTDLVRREMAAVFDMSCAEYDAYMRTFSVSLRFPAEVCKPIRAPRSSPVDPYEVDLVAAYQLPVLPIKYRRYRKDYQTAWKKHCDLLRVVR